MRTLYTGRGLTVGVVMCHPEYQLFRCVYTPLSAYLTVYGSASLF